MLFVVAEFLVETLGLMAQFKKIIVMIIVYTSLCHCKIVTFFHKFSSSYRLQPVVHIVFYIV